MGAGSRIRHQHHSVSPASGPAVAEMESEPPSEPIQIPYNPADLVRRSDHANLYGFNPGEIRDQMRGVQDGIVGLEGSTWTDEPTDGWVQGTVRVSQPAPGQYAVDGSGLTCNCGQDDCAHTRVAAAAVEDDLNNRHYDPVRNRTAVHRVLAEIAQEHQASVAAQAGARDRWPQDTGTSYTNDFGGFQRAYDQARDRARRGEPAIPYMTENATDGLGARDGGRAFGVELEFDFDDSVRDWHGARAAIARDLHAAGLAQDDGVYGYHASNRAGYTDSANAWRFESDSSVSGGEVVSPIMYDEPHTWQNLARVCDIIRRHGGRASVRTGGHVHVSTHDFDHGVENHNRLLNTYAAYEDTLFRLAQNPAQNAHRGLAYCQPNTAPATGYRTVSDARRANVGHGIAVNMGGMRGNQRDHIEYRMWDGSLDPATIQTQVKVSLGVTDAAFRNAGSSEAPNGGQREPVGSHRRRFGRRRLEGEAWRESTASFRRLVDHIFRRDADKEQATALFATTRWQNR